MLMDMTFRCQPIRWNELLPMIARQELTRSTDQGRTSFFLRLGALTNSPSLRPPNAHFFSQSLRLRDYDACILLPCPNAPLQRYAAGVGMMMGVHGRIATRGSQLQPFIQQRSCLIARKTFGGPGGVGGTKRRNLGQAV